MKSAITLACLLLVSSRTSAQDSGQDIVRALGNETLAYDEGNKRFQRLPPDEKAEVLGLVILQAQAYGRGEDLSKQEKFPVTSPQDFMTTAALLLYENATDAQKISAFGNLAGFGQQEYEAAQVLASCESKAGLKIIDALARERLKALGPTMTAKAGKEPPDADRLAFSFYGLVSSLSKSANAEGLPMALRLRNETAERYPTVNSKVLTSEMDRKIFKTTGGNPPPPQIAPPADVEKRVEKQ